MSQYLKVSRTSVNRWIQSYLTQGISGLKGRDVKCYILAEFSVEYKNSNIYKLLHALNLSWITTRSKHPKQSIEAQENFKKIPNKNAP